MSKKSIVKFDDLDIEVLSSEQELVELTRLEKAKAFSRSFRVSWS